jgi:hypothetical protein
MDERRRHDRALKALEFTCTIDGKPFEAQSLDISAGGAFMATPLLVPTGAVARIVPQIGEEHGATRAVTLHGLVVRQERSPRTGVALQWLKADTNRGLSLLEDVLSNIVGLAPAVHPQPPAHISALPDLEYDFILQETRPGRARSDAWDARQTGDFPMPGWRIGPPEGGPPVAAAPPPAEDDFDDDKTEPEKRRLVFRPTSVEVRAGVERIPGVVHSQSHDELLLALSGKRALRLGEVTVVYPVPARGQKIHLEIDCVVRAAEPMEDVDAVAHDLTILRIHGHRGAELWVRWISHLYTRK